MFDAQTHKRQRHFKPATTRKMGEPPKKAHADLFSAVEEVTEKKSHRKILHCVTLLFVLPYSMLL